MGTKFRKAIFVSISKAIRGEIVTATKGAEYLDLARGFWRNIGDKAEQAELLVAVDCNIIKGVWEIDRTKGWRPMTKDAVPHRIYTDIDPKRKYCSVTAVTPKEAEKIGQHVSVLGIKGKRQQLCFPVGYNF